jgi:hypothetical protein
MTIKKGDMVLWERKQNQTREYHVEEVDDGEAIVSDEDGAEYTVPLKHLVLAGTNMSRLERVMARLRESAAAEKITLEYLKSLDNKALLKFYTSMPKKLRAKKITMDECKMVIKECKDRGL